MKQPIPQQRELTPIDRMILFICESQKAKPELSIKQRTELAAGYGKSIGADIIELNSKCCANCSASVEKIVKTFCVKCYYDLVIRYRRGWTSGWQKKLTASDREKMCDLALRGYSQRYIAMKFKVTTTTVGSVFKKEGLAYFESQKQIA